MGRKRVFKSLSVFLNSRHVGQLARESTGAMGFSYDRSWLEWEHCLPISHSLPLSDRRHIGAPVISMLENLLPDDESIRRRVAERVGAQGLDAFSLLSEIGRDCAGALLFLPDGKEPQPLGELTGDPVGEEGIAAILRDLDAMPLGIRKGRGFRISLAGAQAKTALLLRGGEWVVPTGTTPTTHIIKPGIGKLNGMDLSNSVENEYLCLRLMEAFGLRAAKAEIMRFEDQKALVVERFDRHWTTEGALARLPQEDCCQALSVPWSLKYQSDGGPGVVEIMDLLLGSDRAAGDRRDFFKANVLFWLIGATDGHAKNFSVHLKPAGRFQLTPLYDVLTVCPDFEARRISRGDYRLAMRMGKSRRYRIVDIIGRHIEETGLKSGLSLDEVADIFADIAGKADKALEATFTALPQGFPARLLDSIASSVKSGLKKLEGV